MYVFSGVSVREGDDLSLSLIIVTCNTRERLDTIQHSRGRGDAGPAHSTTSDLRPAARAANK